MDGMLHFLQDDNFTIYCVLSVAICHPPKSPQIPRCIGTSQMPITQNIIFVPHGLGSICKPIQHICSRT